MIISDFERSVGLQSGANGVKINGVGADFRRTLENNWKYRLPKEMIELESCDK